METINSLFLVIVVFARMEDQSSGEVERLIAQLGSDQNNERQAAYKALKELGPAVVPALRAVTAPRSSLVFLRVESLLRVIEIQSRLTPNLRKAVPGIEEELESGDLKTWTKKFFDLVRRIDAPTADFPAINRNDLNPLFPEAVQGARSVEQLPLLREIGRHQLVAAGPAILNLLADSEPDVSWAAAHALHKIKWHTPSKDILTLLQSSESQKRRLALWALKLWNVDEIATPIIELLDSKDAEVRLSTINAVGEMGFAKASPPLVAMISNKTSTDDVLEAVATALGLIENGGGGKELRSLLQSENEMARRGAIMALGEIGNKTDIPQLIPFLQNRSKTVKGATIVALGKLDAKEAIPEIMNLLSARLPDETWKPELLRVLGHSGDRAAIQALTPLLKSKEWFVCCAALDTIGAFNLRDCSKDVATLLQHPELSVRSMAVIALGKLDAKEMIPDLRIRMESGAGEGSRNAAAASLCRMGVREALMPLLKCVEESLGAFRSGPMDPEDAEWAPLTPLNAIRHGDICERLKGMQIGDRMRGTTIGLLQQLSQQAGLLLETPETESWKEDIWMIKKRTIGRACGQLSVFDALDELLPGEPYSFVLEPDRIRVVRTFQALDFWKKWAAQNGLK